MISLAANRLFSEAADIVICCVHNEQILEHSEGSEQ